MNENQTKPGETWRVARGRVSGNRIALSRNREAAEYAPDERSPSQFLEAGVAETDLMQFNTYASGAAQ